MKKTRKRWSLVSAVVAFGLIAAFVPWQAFAQEGSVTTEEATTEISVVEQDAEEVSVEEEKASEVVSLPDSTTDTEDAFVLDENTDDVADENTGTSLEPTTSSEAFTLDESDTSLQEAEDTPPLFFKQMR